MKVAALKCILFRSRSPQQLRTTLIDYEKGKGRGEEKGRGGEGKGRGRRRETRRGGEGRGGEGTKSQLPVLMNAVNNVHWGPFVESVTPRYRGNPPTAFRKLNNTTPYKARQLLVYT